jgi:hypothetical protein
LTDDAFGDADLLSRDGDAGPERFNFSAGCIQFRFADHLFLHQLLTAAKRQFCFAQSGLVLGRTATRGLELGFADAQ